MKKYAFLFVVAGLLFFACCENNYIPKPKGFLRLDLPSKKYVPFDSLNFPYSFFIPDYVKLTSDDKNPDQPYWINLNFKPFNAILYISYKKINKNLDVYLDDSRTFVNKHIPKASAINEKQYINEKERVFGLVFNIEGSEAASPLQFYLTDSTQHFLRAALYFNFTPNNDSLAPVIDYIKQDVGYLIDTFKWKKGKEKTTVKEFPITIVKE